MRRKSSWTVAWLIACSVILIVNAVRAAAPERPARSAEPAAVETHVTTPTPPPAPTGALTADEQRVVNWLVGQIHRLDGSKDLLVDFSADDVRRATGVDVRSVDAEHIRVAVRDALGDGCPEKTRHSEAGSPVPATPATPAASPARTADPDSQSNGPGLGA